MKDIVVEVRGGLVVEIYSDVPGIRLILVDWDNIQEGDDPFCWGNAAPLNQMPDDTCARYREVVRREETEEAAAGSA